MLGKKAKKKARKAKEKAKRAIHEVTRPDTERADTGRVNYPPAATSPEYGMAPPELPPSAMAEPDYPDDARAVQRTPREDRKRKSAIKKKTIKAMHVEVNRRIAAVGAQQTVLDEDMSDHEKFVQLTRQTGNIGDTLANPSTVEPVLLRSELIRLMALAAAWAQSLSDKRGR